MSTTAAVKASTSRTATLSVAACKSLGITGDITVKGMSAAFTSAQAQRAVVALEAYALSQGWAGPKMTGAAISTALGTTAGNVSALLRAGAILNRAGTHAGSIGPEAVTLCQNTNAQQTSSLDALTGKALADAVKRMRRDALDLKAESQGRKAQPEGKGKGKGAPKTAGADLKADEVTDKGRASVALQMLRAIKSDHLETVGADDRASIVGMLASMRAEIDRISRVLAVEDKTGQPIKATPATVVKATRKATPKDTPQVTPAA